MILYGTYITYITANDDDDDDVLTITLLAIRQANLIWTNIFK